MEKIKFLDLFAGIGGFSLGLERAGMECVGQVEIDSYCNKVLEKHWPHVKRIKDVHDVKGNTFSAVELICGGVPCQPASQAGKRGGTEDDRWLWPEAFRLVQSINPTWCLFENVYGIITLEDGVVFDNLLSELEGFGYEVQTFIIPACSVNSPHRRDRVWIVANSKSCGSGRTSNEASGTAERSNWNKAEQFKFNGKLQPFPNTKGNGLQKRGVAQKGQTGQLAGSSHVPNTAKPGLERKVSKSKFSREQSGLFAECCEWAVESSVCRVANGISNRVDRLKALGNAVVPQVVEVLGAAIVQAEDQKIFPKKGEYGSFKINRQQPHEAIF